MDISEIEDLGGLVSLVSSIAVRVEQQGHFAASSVALNKDRSWKSGKL
jgi:hypothetical protein